MKILVVIILTMLPCFMFFTCGADGERGAIYLAIDWEWYLDKYWDDNPNIPWNLRRNAEYRCGPGTYNFKYYCSNFNGDEWMWEGTYTLIANEGQPGEFLKDGADGATRYYKFFCSGLSYPTLTFHKHSKIKHFISKDIKKYESINWIKSGDLVYETFTSETNEKINVAKQLYIKEK